MLLPWWYLIIGLGVAGTVGLLIGGILGQAQREDLAMERILAQDRAMVRRVMGEGDEV